MTLLEVVNVTKRFGGLVAVDKVSFKVEKGERLGIVGPNGSGKTTLYNVINGVYKPEEGRVIFEGKDITDLPPYERAKLGIARAFQIPRPFPNLTVRENVAVGALFGSLRGEIGVDEALEIADDVLKTVGLYEKRFVEAGRLTVTEKKRLELARALAMKPKLLLLDEVAAGLNPAEIDDLVRILKKVHEEENIAIMAMVEHLMHAIIKFTERVIIMHQGRKLLEGPTEETLKHPLVVEIYLGAPEVVTVG